MTREEAIKTVHRIFNYCEEIDCHLPEDEQSGYEMYPDIRAVIEYIRDTPEADVVEVVRCKDCIHREKYECNHIMLGSTKLGVTDDYFCADGERKETE